MDMPVDAGWIGSGIAGLSVIAAAARHYLSDAKREERRKDREAKNDRVENVHQKSVINGVIANDKVLLNLQAEMTRLSERVLHLEEQVATLTGKLANVRLIALDCYQLATACECEGRNRLLEHLKQIIKDA